MTDVPPEFGLDGEIQFLDAFPDRPSLGRP
jgi:hypothetical protein